ncbi:hypothetical protein PV327_004620 [Microctonus hyperodae]|uniref:Uncharacterized protein n=1 Tax=Microctonus hyperodae TaxID=165561 RepID=A0AA39FCT3_MICHY|nr:hypothetical protein PV327_004620 [Microctonus hyperodae]
MYVIYPVEELLKIYENPIRRVSLTSSSRIAVRNSRKLSDSCQEQQQLKINSSPHSKSSTPVSYTESKSKNKNNNTDNNRNNKLESSKVIGVRDKKISSKNKDDNKRNNKIFATGKLKNCPIMQNNRNSGGEEGINPLKELTHASLNESLKQHNGNALKLVQTE